MRYLEYNFFNINSQESREILIAFLSEKGYSGFIESKSGIKTYLPESEKNENDLKSLLNRLFSQKQSINFTCKPVEEQNWNEKWENDFQAIEIEKKVRIRASFHKKDASFLYDILIDPKMSFGTGHHETTRLMIMALLELDITNKRVLDLGCGTGVLGILASKMNANSILAVDVDKWAYENCLENVRSNYCTNVRVMEGGIELIQDEEFQIILANINRNVLIENMNTFSDLLNPLGILVLSGIMEQDVDIMRNSAAQSGFVELSISFEKNWYCLVFNKPG